MIALGYQAHEEASHAWRNCWGGVAWHPSSPRISLMVSQPPYINHGRAWQAEVYVALVCAGGQPAVARRSGAAGVQDAAAGPQQHLQRGGLPAPQVRGSQHGAASCCVPVAVRTVSLAPLHGVAAHSIDAPDTLTLPSIGPLANRPWEVLSGGLDSSVVRWDFSRLRPQQSWNLNAEAAASGGERGQGTFAKEWRPCVRAVGDAFMGAAARGHEVGSIPQRLGGRNVLAACALFWP